ncbi:hypothetical protein [Bacillus marasmi]|uniref:hypothetical protein n=1 Tax=Bacillus marasmi TaxID=1926279 RepID=UPI001FE5BFDA|nr:hypothetical protein [Bacillus marasmi]
MIIFEKDNETINEMDIVTRAFFLFIGFGLAVSGGTTSIMYLNLLPVGFTFLEYLHFISHRLECYLLPIGIIIIWISIYFPAKEATKR